LTHNIEEDSSRGEIMKLKIIALFLALSLAAWAQSTPQTPPASGNAPAAEEAGCPYGDKTAQADAKEGCCAGHAKDAKCCGGQDAKQCKHSASAKADCCGKDCDSKCKDHSCCKGEKEAGKEAAACCSGNHCMAHGAGR
jgi:hypothetical protein